jgi:hypothetical protein
MIVFARCLCWLEEGFLRLIYNKTSRPPRRQPEDLCSEDNLDGISTSMHQTCFAEVRDLVRSTAFGGLEE